MDTIHQRFPQYDEGGQALIDKAYAIASAEARFGNDNSILSSLLGVLRHAKATPYWLFIARGCCESPLLLWDWLAEPLYNIPFATSRSPTDFFISSSLYISEQYKRIIQSCIDYYKKP